MPIESRVRSRARRLRLEVDGHKVSVPAGTTVLYAAELAGVSIPSLCSHKELSPFGGCRLCAVDIAGIGGHPLACSTVVTDSMEVTTDTDGLRELRQEILQLILSEHPCSCIFCGEQDECRRSLTTIRKAGVTTGCRSCPNDGDCELQRVVEQVGITEIGYPITYRGLEAEHDDPFFDRDYNLCILCGRCVRVCNEVRGTSVLAFKYRGRKTLIGPAFGTSHIEAGCEFCGACVSVCPTGALAEKVSKWDGKADGVETSTCPFCGIGCRLEVAHKDGRLSSVSGALDSEINDGQLCVRGRFGLPEATHHYLRARQPMLRRGAYFRVANWDEALGEVAERLKQVAPDEFLMLVSSDLSNEGLFAAQRLVRSGLGANGVDSTAGASLPGGPGVWSRLFSLPVSIKALSEAETVIVAGLDSRFSFSVVGVQVRRAMREGARLVAVDARESNLARMADEWVRPEPGDEARALVEAVRKWPGGGTLAVVVGPRVFDCPGAGELVSRLETLAQDEGVTVVPLVHGANIRGALELGALGGVLPGPRPDEGRGLTLADMRAGKHPKVLYLVGEAPFTTRPDCDFVVAQDLYLPPFAVDAFLPAASFAEAEGTLTNLEGRVQELRAVERLPVGAVHGFALPDWKIFSDLAGRLGRSDLEYADAAAVRKTIRAEVSGFAAEGDRAPRRMAPAELPVEPAGDTVQGTGRFVLVPERASFRHRGIDLAGVVEGLGELHLEEGLRMNVADMTRLGVEPGGTVTVSLGSRRVAVAARPDPDCPRRAAYVSLIEAWGGVGGEAADPALELLSRLAARPVRVRISAGDRSPARKRGGAHVPGR